MQLFSFLKGGLNKEGRYESVLKKTIALYVGS